MLQRNLQYYLTCAETVPKWPKSRRSILQVIQNIATVLLPKIDFREFDLFCKSLFSLSRRAQLDLQEGISSALKSAEPEKLVAYRRRRPERPPAGTIACHTLPGRFQTRCLSHTSLPHEKRASSINRGIRVAQGYLCPLRALPVFLFSFLCVSAPPR